MNYIIGCDAHKHYSQFGGDRRLVDSGIGYLVSRGLDRSTS